MCGYLAGTTGKPVTVLGVHPVLNSLNSPTAFALDGQTMIDAEARIDRLGQEIIGVFHSHPAGPARPSERDRRDASVYDPAGHFLHLIVSLCDDEADVRAWQFIGDTPIEVGLLDGR